MHYFVSNEKRASPNTRTQLATVPARRAELGQAMEGEGGQQRNRGGQRWSGLRALWGEGSFFGGVAYFLTAYFFVCFIQFLQRVQQFLWGENVRGSWRKAEKTVSLPALVSNTFPFPALFYPQSCSCSPSPTQMQGGVGDWGLGPCHSRPGRHVRAVDKQNTPSGLGRVPGCTKEGARLSISAQRCHLPGDRAAALLILS